MSSSKKQSGAYYKKQTRQREESEKKLQKSLKKWFVKDANSFVTTHLQCCSHLDQ